MSMILKKSKQDWGQIAIAVALIAIILAIAAMGTAVLSEKGTGPKSISCLPGQFLSNIGNGFVCSTDYLLGLYLYWKFQQPSGVFTDSSGHGFTSQPVTGTWTWMN